MQFWRISVAIAAAIATLCSSAGVAQNVPSSAEQPQPLPPARQQPPQYQQPARYEAPTGDSVRAATRPDALGAMHAPPSVGQYPTSRQAIAPRAPFELSPAEEAYRDQYLKLWETESAKIITFKCAFERWEYIRAFTPAGRDIALVKGTGELAYAKPDKGSFRVDEIHRWKQVEKEDGTLEDTWPKAEDEVGERWVCDGQQVYNYAHKEKQLQVSTIPPELQGKAIIDGPLPFLFGAKAEKLTARYWIRVTKADDNEIWLDTYPKLPADAMNYSRVELILSQKGLVPTAMQVYMPNGDRNVYMFGEATINSQLDRFFGVFKPPRTPYGWTKVELETPQRAGQSPPPDGEASARDARRPMPRSRF